MIIENGMLFSHTFIISYTLLLLMLIILICIGYYIKRKSEIKAALYRDDVYPFLAVVRNPYE